MRGASAREEGSVWGGLGPLAGVRGRSSARGHVAGSADGQKTGTGSCCLVYDGSGFLLEVVDMAGVNCTYDYDWSDDPETLCRLR